jgi:hypothetical protein
VALSGGEIDRIKQMSLKNSVVLVLILLLLGGTVLYLTMSQPGEKQVVLPDVWSYQQEDIQRIHILLPRENKGITFVIGDDERWFIDTPEKKPVDLQRWGGIVLLTSGPQSRRVIASQVKNLHSYGLDSPSLKITLTIQGQPQLLNVIVGDHTPDEKAVYVMLKEHQTVYLLDQVWFEVMARLVREPPSKINHPRITGDKS